MICSTPLCENYTEGSTHYCGSCNTRIRKEAKDALKVKKKYVIPKTSKKKKEDLKLYLKRRKRYLEKYPKCQLNFDVCTKVATQIHHVSGRIGSNLTNDNGFKSTCAECHKKLHDVLSAKERREKGLLK